MDRKKNKKSAKDALIYPLQTSLRPVRGTLCEYDVPKESAFEGVFLFVSAQFIIVFQTSERSFRRPCENISFFEKKTHLLGVFGVSVPLHPAII
jgi:hypothetical protein